jgi:hypothetical protein
MSFRKTVLQNYKAIDAVSMAADITSPSTNIQYMDNITVQLVFNGASAAGQFIIEGSADDVHFTALDITPGMFASDPDGSILVDMNNLSFSHIRIKYLHQAGDSGSLTAFIEGKSI